MTRVSCCSSLLLKSGKKFYSSPLLVCVLMMTTTTLIASLGGLQLADAGGSNRRQGPLPPGFPSGPGFSGSGGPLPPFPSGSGTSAFGSGGIPPFSDVGPTGSGSSTFYGSPTPQPTTSAEGTGSTSNTAAAGSSSYGGGANGQSSSGGATATTTTAAPTPPPTPAPTTDNTIPCGRLSASECIIKNSECIVEGGRCIYSDCGLFSDPQTGRKCKDFGCVYEAGECDIPPCTDFDTTSCSQVSYCQLSTTTTTADTSSSCVDRESDCSTLTASSSVCLDGGCSWNLQADPKCFSLFGASAACSAQSDEGNCLARSCQWASSSSTCSDVQTATDACKSQTNTEVCYDYSNAACYFDVTVNSCQAVTEIDGMDQSVPAVVGNETTPSIPFPNEEFTVSVYGPGLTGSDKMFLLNSDSSNGGTTCSDSASASASTTVQYKSFLRSSQATFSIAQGTYSLCYRPAASSSSTIWVRTLVVQNTAPLPTAATTSTSPVYQDLQFTLTITGTSFSATDGASLVISTTATCQESLPTVNRVNAAGTQASITATLTETGTYDLCYSNPEFESDKVRLSGAVTVSGVAPHLNETTLVETASTITVTSTTTTTTTTTTGSTTSGSGGGDSTTTTTRSLSIQDFNYLHCSGSKTANTEGLPANHTWGPFQNPDYMYFGYGSTFQQYPAGDRCLYYLKPTSTSGTTTDPIYINIEMLYTALDEGDEIRVFLPSGAPSIVTCSSFTSSGEATCKKNLCSWNAATSVCEIGLIGLSNCPTDISGYSLTWSVNFQRQAASSISSITTTYGEGALLAICTDDSLGAGTGFGWQYTAANSLCLNDCADSAGTVHGTCTNSGGSYACSCSSGWQGEDCSQQTVCTGTLASAEVLTGSSGTRTITASAVTSCGFAITVSPQGSGLSRTAQYGIGLELEGLTLSGASSESNILMYRESYSGALFANLTSSTIPATNPRYLVSASPSIYLQFDGIRGDSLTFKYKVVSTVCPGPQGSSGIPATADECGGRGSCVDVDIEKPVTLPSYAKQCVCTGRYASSGPYESCDICAFGSNQNSFPDCNLASNCTADADCANGGTCTITNNVGTCGCPVGFYGSLCQHASSTNTPVGQDLLQVQLGFDGFAANARSDGTTDGTVMPCQLPGAFFGCVNTTRSRGKLYGDFDTTTSESTSPKNNRRQRRHRNRRQSTTDSSDFGSDIGTSLNSIVIDGNYRDMVRTSPVIDTKMDATQPFTVSAWVKATAETNGFLAAKVDSVFYPSGGSPALEKGLRDVQARYANPSTLLLARDDVALYWGIYLNGAQKRVDFIMSDAARDIAGGADAVTNDNVIVRHFRMDEEAPDLFSGEWVYFTFMFTFDDSRYEGQVFVDAVSIDDSPNYVQCFPRAPKAVATTAPANISDPTATVVEEGGALIVGAFFKGDIDEFRMYNERLTRATVVSIGGTTLFSHTLSVATNVLVGMAIVGVVVIVICFGICLGRLHQEAQKRKADEMAKQVAVKPLGKNYNSQTTDVRPFSGQEISSPTYSPQYHHNQRQQVPPPPGTVPQYNSPAPQPQPQQQQQQPGGGGMFAKMGQVAGGAVGAVKTGGQKVMNFVTPGRQQQQQQQQPQPQPQQQQQIQMAYPVQPQPPPAPPGPAIIASNNSIAGESGGVQMTEDNSILLQAHKWSTEKLLRAANDLTQQSQEYILRAQIIVDCWQMISLFFIGFEWPYEFEFAFGYVANVFSLEFSFSSLGINFDQVFYAINGIALVAFILLCVALCVSTPKNQHEMRQEHQNIIQDKITCKEQGVEYKGRTSFGETLFSLLILAVSGLYLPVTRNSVVVLFCHPSVQCVYDCYNEAAHVQAVTVSVVMLILYSVLTIVMLTMMILRQRKRFAGYIEGSGMEMAEAWEMYIKLDQSPYSTLYSGFEYKWAYFHVVMMVIKGLMCFMTLGLPENSLAQLVLIMGSQCIFTILSFVTAPFVLDVCDYLLEISQMTIISAITITCMYRAQETLAPWGWILTGVCGLVIVGQVLLLVKKERKHGSKADEEEEDEQQKVGEGGFAATEERAGATFPSKSEV